MICIGIDLGMLCFVCIFEKNQSRANDGLFFTLTLVQLSQYANLFCFRNSGTYR